MHEQQEKETRTREAVPAFVAAARLLVERNQPDDALKQVTVALTYDAANADARLLKGQLLLARKDFAHARDELELYVRAWLQDRDAAQLLELCRATRPEDPASLQKLSLVLARQRLFPLAVRLALSDAEVLKVYRTQLRAAWPGVEERLNREGDGQLSLDLDPAQGDRQPGTAARDPAERAHPERNVGVGPDAAGGPAARHAEPRRRHPGAGDLTPIKSSPLRGAVPGEPSQRPRPDIAWRHMPLTTLDLRLATQA